MPQFGPNAIRIWAVLANNRPAGWRRSAHLLQGAELQGAELQGAENVWSASPQTCASWLDAVENFFSKMICQRIRRGVFRSIADLQSAINADIARTEG
jgi:hypothetical protein